MTGRVFSFLLVGAVLIGSADNAIAAEKMIRIEGGVFTMGSDTDTPDEKPAHRVRVRTFWIDRVPVTNREYAAFLNAWSKNPRVKTLHVFDLDDNDARIAQVNGVFQPHDGFEEHPVVESTWFGAREFCRWQGKRLPSEAEWEFAARGPEGRRYPWGNQKPDPNRALYDKGWGATTPVGMFKAGATPEGVLNMAGNVHEWTSSLHEPYPYRAADGRENPNSRHHRVTRGGAGDDGIKSLRATYRGEYVSRNPWAGHRNIGFRCARSAKPNT